MKRMMIALLLATATHLTATENLPDQAVRPVFDAAWVNNHPIAATAGFTATGIVLATIGSYALCEAIENFIDVTAPDAHLRNSQQVTKEKRREEMWKFFRMLGLGGLVAPTLIFWGIDYVLAGCRNFIELTK